MRFLARSFCRRFSFFTLCMLSVTFWYSISKVANYTWHLVSVKPIDCMVTSKFRSRANQKESVMYEWMWERVRNRLKESRLFRFNASYDNINRKLYEFNLARYIPISFMLAKFLNEKPKKNWLCYYLWFFIHASFLRAFSCHNIASVCQLINYVYWVNASIQYYNN